MALVYLQAMSFGIKSCLEASQSKSKLISNPTRGHFMATKKFWSKNGRKAGLIGGPARARALSPERRKEIATLAARARYTKKS